MDFKKALFISFLSHCFILTPVGNLWFFSPTKKLDNLQITYYKIAPLKVEVEKEIAAKKITDVQTVQRQPAMAEKPKKEKSQVLKKAKPSQIKPPDLKPQETISPKKENIIPSSIPGTTLPNTPECISYYNYLREEIRRFLKRNYTRDHDEGDVGISFVLSQSGELISLNIIEEKSSNDPMLRNLSYDSIRSVAPFKPFPKNLVQKQISFNLTVVFKHN